MFKQPFEDVLSSASNVLLAGCGGGYDVVGAIPLALALIECGKTVTFASLSFTQLHRVPGHRPVAGVPHLYVTTPEAATRDWYCPEAWLATWLSSRVRMEVPVWCFENVGVLPLRHAYRFLVEQHAIDTLILVDGGIDALLRGDEASLGTPVEDLSSVAAVESIDLPRKMLACVGFGAELRDGISHAQVLDRIAQLASLDAWLGTWPLLKNTAAGLGYLEALAFIAERQNTQKGSHIHSVVSRSMLGGFGSEDGSVWLSPLASLYWFFELDRVARTNLLIPHIQNCETLWDVAAVVEGIRKSIAVRRPSQIPL